MSDSYYLPSDPADHADMLHWWRKNINEEQLIEIFDNMNTYEEQSSLSVLVKCINNYQSPEEIGIALICLLEKQIPNLIEFEELYEENKNESNE